MCLLIYNILLIRLALEQSVLLVEIQVLAVVAEAEALSLLRVRIAEPPNLLLMVVTKLLLRQQTLIC